MDRILNRIDTKFDHFISVLDHLSRIPGVSAEPAPSKALEHSARAVAAAMEAVGLEHTEVLELDGTHPYVYGDWLHAPGKPTVLLYAHHDVQPVGRLERWKSPPFEPEIRDGRMYGRGVVDDKAGFVIQLAAISAWLDDGGSLPCNIKFIVEGEEETGSSHLEAFLSVHAERLQADCIVLTDTANLDTGIPSITTRLRGIVGVEVRVKGLTHPLHSGMWGGPVADPVMALVKILGSLVDAHGEVAIPGFCDDIKPPNPLQQRQLDALPWDEQSFRRDAGLTEGMELGGAPGVSAYEKLWYRPALSINALMSVPVKGCSNQLTDQAEARLSVRLVPDQDPHRCLDLLMRAIQTDPPFGVTVEVTPTAVGGWWTTKAEGPAFDAAARAMEAGYGVPCTFIGCGGTIPFVEPFASVMGGIPAILVGLEDPICKAHSENESLHLGDWKKGMRASAQLYAELASVL